MLFSNLYKWIKQQQQMGKNTIAKEKRNEKNELTAYSMARHPNWDRVLRTTRADIKKSLLWTGDYWNISKKERASGWLFDGWQAG